MNCEYIRDIYPDVLSGTAEPVLAQQVRAHIASCGDCRAEIAVVESIRAVETPVPAGLQARVSHALRVPQPRWRPSRSGIAMAATLAAAVIGGSLLVEPRSSSPQQDEAGFGFVSVEDAMSTGATSLEDLSIEELEKLLGEMES